MTITGNISDSAEAFDLNAKLRQRLLETNLRKERTQAQINAQTEELQRMFMHKPKKHRDSLDSMDAKIIDLEKKRTRSSLILSEEKKILRQIDIIEKAKIQLGEYNKHERSIQEKKNEISVLRDSLRTDIAAIAELNSALSKLELANRLGCTISELQTCVVDCPEGKLGFVIGKSGATIKHIEQRTGVRIDIDKLGSKIHLQGSKSVLEEAVKEVEKITLAITEDVSISPDVVTYLLAKRLGSLAELQQVHPDVHFELSKNPSLLKLRGKPDDVLLAKGDIHNLNVKKQTKTLSQREASVVVGKGGATIDKLVEDHGILISVNNARSAGDDKKERQLNLIGPEVNVDSAFMKVEEILYQNEVVQDFIMVNVMQRNKFLMNSGALIKRLQAQISGEINGDGVLLFFEKRSQSDNSVSFSEPSKITIKASRANLLTAKQIVQDKVNAFDAGIITMSVRPDIIPAILGKGGETINNLRQEMPGADIDLDKVTGVMQIHAEDEDTRMAVRAAIDNIVIRNQVRKVEVQKTIIGLLLGEFGKDIRKQVTGAGASLSVDFVEESIVLRGTDEQITESAAILREFIDCNYTEEYEVFPDDHGLILQGGSESLLKRVETDHDVKGVLRKERNMLILRGKKDHVEAGLSEIKRFLHGGDGFVVCKLKVPEGLIGVVIGKGGSNISKLESENDGINIQAIGDTSLFCIRGPEDKVYQCRSQVITQLATAKITKNVLITPEQHESLVRGETLKKFTSGTGVMMTLSGTSVRIRGISSDVRDVKALLQEHLTGTYEQVIELEPSQLSRVRSAVKDPSHFERIHDTTNTEVTLDTPSSSIIIRGKHSNVKKAKTVVLGFLDFILPSEIAKFKVSRHLLNLMGNATELAKIAAESGASISLDRDISAILVRSAQSELVRRAVALLDGRMLEWEKLVYVEKFDHSDAWLLSVIIGKGGATIQGFRKETSCNIDILKDEISLVISGESEDDVKKGKEVLHEITSKARKECMFIDLPETAMPAFIGKSGAHIKQLSAEHGIEIERLRKGPPKIQIKGDELSVMAAADAVKSWLNEWEVHNEGVSFQVDETAIPAILGKGGSAISEIQRDHNVRINIDKRSGRHRHHLDSDVLTRVSRTISVRGGNHNSRTAAAEKIQQIEHAHLARFAELESSRRKAAAKQEARLKEAHEESVRENAAPNNQMNQQPDERKKDRSSEFAIIPVGLTVVESRTKKPKKTKISKERTVVPTGGTDAGQSLFNLLVSDNSPEIIGKGLSPSRSSSVALIDEQWDSSTVSSAAISSSIDTEEDNRENVFLVDKSSYKSTSGFTVRV